ncbi:hypothetical protein GCM10009602_53750 [Nocardiopsis tropica]
MGRLVPPLCSDLVAQAVQCRLGRVTSARSLPQDPYDNEEDGGTERHHSSGDRQALLRDDVPCAHCQGGGGCKGDQGTCGRPEKTGAMGSVKVDITMNTAGLYHMA